MENFVPDIYQKSIYKIDYKKLKKAGIKCILFDLDNTIAPVSVSVPNKKMKDLIEEVKDMGFKVIIMSNSPKSRLEPFKEILNVDCSASSMKPLSKKYKKIMKIYNFKDIEIAAVGDQILTDIYGANRLDITTILVNPLSTNDFVFTKFNRMIERYIFKKLSKKGLLKKGNYYD